MPLKCSKKLILLFEVFLFVRDLITLSNLSYPMCKRRSKLSVCLPRLRPTLTTTQQRNDFLPKVVAVQWGDRRGHFLLP